MLLMLVSLLCCVPAAKACLQCDRKIRLLHEDFILSASTVDNQIELKKICDHAYVTYKETSQERKGVIGSVTFEAIQIMEKGRKILEKHLDTFIRDGILKRRVMDCFSCRYRIYICPSPSGQQDCSEYPVLAEEGGQALLNCFLPWHRLLLGKTEYHYSWAPGEPGAKKLNESDFSALVVTDDSSVVLNQLHVDEQGTYRCSLQNRNGIVFYRATFLLTVAPVPDQTHRPVITLPPLPHGDDQSPFQPTEALLVPVIAMVTALSLAASVGITAVLGLVISQMRAAGELHRRGKEGKAKQNTV
ncbi:izumo sperm-egg fusion protein 1 isoform X4 [Sparus aurata]|uniref:izumo sperm-egg fusion protein 1 isoform X4 n=1 Tax=Sparus aurata TaxID=8175 RepID=UPI0011C14D3B|nr:izumo sperm-egg fusion protein 1 isoform X4 [Sparus aurata]